MLKNDDELDIENDETNLIESKESPNPGVYGLWYIGQGNGQSSNLQKSFLNCDAIPFSGFGLETHIVKLNIMMFWNKNIKKIAILF